MFKILYAKFKLALFSIYVLCKVVSEFGKVVRELGIIIRGFCKIVRTIGKVVRVNYFFNIVFGKTVRLLGKVVRANYLFYIELGKTVRSRSKVIRTLCKTDMMFRKKRILLKTKDSHSKICSGNLVLFKVVNHEN